MINNGFFEEIGFDSCVFEEGKKKRKKMRERERERERGRARVQEVRLMRQGIRWVPSG